MDNSLSKLFYVYAYCDPRAKSSHLSQFGIDNTPFYIGYGSKNRMYSHLNEARSRKNGCNNFKTNKILSILSKGLEPIIIKLADNLSKDDAIALEIKLINSIGTRTNVDKVENLGPLSNLHCGGHGGYIPRSTESLKQLSRKLKGRKITWADKISKSKMGQTLSDETKSKVSAKTKEALQDPERRAKISATHLGKVKTTDHANKLREHLANKCNTPEQRKRASERMKNRVISQNERDRIAKGVSEFNKNTVIINDGVINKRIKMDVLELFISQGWVRGRIKKVST